MLSPDTGSEGMPFKSLAADPAEIEILSGVLEEICAQQRISDTRDRDECARQLITLFTNGAISREALLRGMKVVADARA